MPNCWFRAEAPSINAVQATSRIPGESSKQSASAQGEPASSNEVSTRSATLCYFTVMPLAQEMAFSRNLHKQQHVCEGFSEAASDLPSSWILRGWNGFSGYACAFCPWHFIMLCQFRFGRWRCAASAAVCMYFQVAIDVHCLAKGCQYVWVYFRQAATLHHLV